MPDDKKSLWTRAVEWFVGADPRKTATGVWRGIEDEEVFTRSSGVAFYAITALVPFLGLVVTLVVQFLPDLSGGDGGNSTLKELRAVVSSAVPPDSAQVIERELVRIQKSPPVSLLSVGLVLTIWLSSSLFAAVIDALNRIYDVKETRNFVKVRLIAIAMTVVQAVVLIGGLLINAFWPWVLEWLRLGTAATILATAVKWVVLFGIVAVSFGLAYYLAPDLKTRRWKWLTPGSVFGTIALLLVSLAFRLYLRFAGESGATYGSLTGAVALLGWLWISAFMFLAGAVLNVVLDDQRKPAPGVPIDQGRDPQMTYDD